MSFLKYVLLSAAFLSSENALAQNNDQQALQKSIREWQPTEISIKNDIATVVLPGKTLTPDAYEAVITSGVCMSIWTKSTPKDFLSDIKLLHVVNMYKSIGFTLENPAATCAEMGKLMDQPAKILLSSKTRVYMPK
ncbi:hypothetical protein PHDIMM138B_22090 [Phytobacter diazotrophicus]